MWLKPEMFDRSEFKASPLACTSKREGPDLAIDPDDGRLAAGSIELPELDASNSLDSACLRLGVSCGRMESRLRLSRDGAHRTDHLDRSPDPPASAGASAFLFSTMRTLPGLP
jgi:hypothetical protein